jgi:hypothetical protein
MPYSAATLSPKGARPEADLLLCCARTALGPGHVERVREILRGPIDWAYFAGVAARNGVTPLLYLSLASAFAREVPAHVLGQLRVHAHVNRLRNEILSQELLRVLGAFKAAGIAAVPLKGPALAAAAYGNVGLRLFTDLDILVRPRNVSRAEELLLELAYVGADAPNEQSRPGVLPPQEYHHAFAHRDGLTVVELHWAFAPGHFSWRCDMDRLWGRLETIVLAGTPVRTLAPEDLLPYLCVHGAKHCWERLEWICCIAELARTWRDRDWRRVLEEARAQGAERLLLLGLMLARDLLGAEPPPAFQQRLQEKPPRASLASSVRRWIFEEGGAVSLPERHAFFLAARERLRDRLAYLAHHLTNVNGRDRVLGKRVGVASRLFRPLRLIASYGNPWRFLRRLIGL